MTEQVALNKRTPIPKPRRMVKKAVPAAVRLAAADYKAAYKSLYGVEPTMRYDREGKWIRVQGQATGVTVRRLREMTAQLKYRQA